jgi:putative cardiolipin synthase
MHNKSLTVDNRATIVGGRNIGDEYMGLHDHFNFRDIDVMGVGPVARQTSDVFDLFWNSGWVIHPNQATRDKADAAAPSQRAAMEKELRRSEELERFSLTPQNWESEFSTLSATLHLGSSEVLTDRPGPDGISNDLYEWITTTIPEVKAELLVTNAYLIPDTSGVSMLAGLIENSVDIKIHTNSLASHDVPAVNSHYKAWRSPLLQAGAGLYEARQDAEIKVSVVDTPPISAKYMGLHSKAMVIDRRFAIIGSANLDPRSAFLNSEMIAVIDSEGLAEELAKAILRDMAPSNSWEVRLDDDGKLQWQNDVETTQRQPARDSFQPIADWFFMLFPKRFY